MRKFSFFCVVFVILALQLGPLTDAQADVVGRLTQVEGRVDLLKGGQLPATPVKTDDGVQPGDVLRTKSLSKAQITFIDNSTMTLAPESRVAIEAYMVDAGQNKRNAVIELFKGIAFMVVNKVYQSTEPDFVVKTQTAIMGIRGTEFGVRLQPNSSDILNFKGRLQVGNVYPEVGQLPQRAFKVAYSFGSAAGGHWIFLDEMQGTSVGRGLPPTLPWTISDEDKRHFFNQMGTGLNICRRNPEAGEEETGGGPPSETISGCAPTTGLTGSDITTKQDLLTAGYYGAWFTPPYTPPRDPKFTGTEPPSNPVTGGPPPPTPPPCDHKPPHHHHDCDRDDHCDKDHHDKCDFHFDRDFFCRRDRDDRFDRDRDSYSRRDHDGKFDFDFAKNFCKPKGHEGFDLTRNSFNFRDRDRRFDSDFAKNFCKPKGHDGPNITNFIHNAAITNPRLLLSQHCPGNGPGEIGGHRGGPPTGINNAVFNPKDKCAPKGNIHQGGPINASFQGGPQGNNHQGPAPGPCGPKNGGGGV